jgi:hypothetical protein
MRQGPTGRRPRGRPNRKQHGGPSRPHSFDSNGPEGRVRGNAHQVYEKYIGMAREAMSAGDRVAAETYYQHAEHYFRIINSSTDPQPDDRRQPRQDSDGRRPPQARPGGGNGGQPVASDKNGEDREGLDRALGVGGPGAGPRQPQAGQDASGQARTRQDEAKQGGGQPRDAQSPDQTRGRRPMRPRPPRDGEQAGGQERRMRGPQQANGHARPEAAQSGAAQSEASQGGDTPHDQAVNGEDTSATDEPTSGNEPVSA